MNITNEYASYCVGLACFLVGKFFDWTGWGGEMRYPGMLLQYTPLHLPKIQKGVPGNFYQKNKKGLILVTFSSVIFTSGCAVAKTNQVPTEVTVTLTAQELADAFEYRDQKISIQIEQLGKDFDSIQKKIISLRNEIAKKVEDCLCPAEMK